jgi:hypothetical protein
MPRGLDEVVFGVVLVLWALLGRRLFRYPERDEKRGGEELKGWMIRHIWPFALAGGVVFVVIGLVRLGPN